MQVLNQGNLPRRLRYYISMSDSDMLEKGIVYPAELVKAVQESLLVTR